jgi:hypothetical protein
MKWLACYFLEWIFFYWHLKLFPSWLLFAAHIFTNIWSSNSKIEGIPSRLLHICCIYPLLWESTIVVKWIWAQAPSALQSLNTAATWSRQFRTIAWGSTLTSKRLVLGWPNYYIHQFAVFYLHLLDMIISLFVWKNTISGTAWFALKHVYVLFKPPRVYRYTGKINLS